MNKAFNVQITNTFKKQYIKVQKQKNFNKNEFEKIVSMLANNEILPPKYRNHVLTPKTLRNMGMSYISWYFVRIQKSQK